MTVPRELTMATNLLLDDFARHAALGIEPHLLQRCADRVDDADARTLLNQRD
jgi:hypothetical protein